MNKPFLLFFFLLLVVLSCTRCKEKCDDSTNPDCPNYVPPIDPCQGTHPVSASFTISQYPGPGNDNLYIETQYHVKANRLIKLYAQQEDAISYKWIIGADTVYTQEYIFDISEDFYDQIIPLKLIVIGQPDLECWPCDDGIDTLTRYVHVQPACTASIYGLYYGAWEDSPQDSFYISFRTFDDEQWSGEDCNGLMGRGLNGDFNDSCRVNVSGRTDNFLRITGSYCAYQTLGDPYGRFYVNPEEHTIYGDYYFFLEVDGHPQQQFKKFNGRKIY